MHLQVKKIESRHFYYPPGKILSPVTIISSKAEIIYFIPPAYEVGLLKNFSKCIALSQLF